MRWRPDITGLALQGTPSFLLDGFAVTGLTADSRAVRPGMLFAALPGVRQDGARFIGEAVARGASVVLAPAGTTWPPGVPPRPLLTDPEPRLRLALFAAAFHRAQPGTVVGVTGTNGKTSTVEFLRQLWQADGRPAASIGTLGLIATGRAPEPGLTTPEPVALHAALAGLAVDGIGHAAIEASSHGLDQFRLDGVRFAAGGFTSFSRDHLDYHGTMARYLAAKLRLFETVLPRGAQAVAAADLDAGVLDALAAIARRRGLAFGTAGAGGTGFALAVTGTLPEGLVVTADGTTCVLPLVGAYQAANVAVAAALALATGLRRQAVLAALPHLTGVRGRLERAARLPNGAAIYVDYAHTPDAIGRVLASIRPHATGRVVIAFGAGGDRDPGKRALMGAAAAAGAELVIVTDDNPRSENPAAIRAAVRAGAPEALEIGDRAAAINAAVAALGPGDVAVIAGKGHEQGQVVAGEVIPFDDLTVARDAARARGGVA